MPPKTTSAGVIMINGDQHRFLTGTPNEWWWWGWGLKLCRSYLIGPHRPSSNLDNRKLQVSHGSSSSTSSCSCEISEEVEEKEDIQEEGRLLLKEFPPRFTQVAFGMRKMFGQEYCP